MFCGWSTVVLSRQSYRVHSGLLMTRSHFIGSSHRTSHMIVRAFLPLGRCPTEGSFYTTHRSPVVLGCIFSVMLAKVLTKFSSSSNTGSSWDPTNGPPPVVFFDLTIVSSKRYSSCFVVAVVAVRLLLLKINQELIQREKLSTIDCLSRHELYFEKEPDNRRLNPHSILVSNRNIRA